MRSAGVAVFVLFGALALSAQVSPPAGARDITQVPAAAQPPNTAQPPGPAELDAPYATGTAGLSATAPAGKLRVYIANLSGSDAAAISSLLTQSLFESKLVVVTENQSNATVVLKGTVLRQPLAEPARAARNKQRRSPARRTQTSRENTPAQSQAGGSLQPPADATPLPDAGELDRSRPDTSLLTDGGMDAGLLDSGALGGGNPAADLKMHRYRLDLEVVNPQGDLLWMSGRGAKALPFEGAEAAVNQVAQQLLQALKAYAPAPGS